MLERQNGTKEPIRLAITTFADIDTARQFGSQLIEAQLVACVNLLPGVESIYRWKGKIEIENEIIVVMKTTESQLQPLESWMEKHHPYDEPEFLVLPIEAGSSSYLKWVRDNVDENEPSPTTTPR